MLSMTYVILRRVRRARLEGRGRRCNSVWRFPESLEGRDPWRPWIPAFASMTSYWVRSVGGNPLAAGGRLALAGELGLFRGFALGAGALHQAARQDRQFEQQDQ